MKRIKYIIFLLVLMGGLGVAAWLLWYRPLAEPVEVIPIKATLKWIHQAQFAGMYVAISEKLYEQRGLEVDLIELGEPNSHIDAVVTGRADFGVAGADEILLARSEGKPVVAVAVIYQESPVIVYALKSSGIKTVADMKGKRLGAQPSSNGMMTIEAMLREGGLDIDKDVIQVPIGFDNQSLVDGSVDVAMGYLINEPLQTEMQGLPVDVIKPSHYGIATYADVLFTSERMIELHPEMVRGFVLASLEGWEVALADQELGLAATMRFVNDTESTEFQQRMLAATESLVKPAYGQPVGKMTYLGWKQLYEQMQEMGLLKESFDLSQAFTHQFLELE